MQQILGKIKWKNERFSGLSQEAQLMTWYHWCGPCYHPDNVSSWVGGQGWNQFSVTLLRHVCCGAPHSGLWNSSSSERWCCSLWSSDSLLNQNLFLHHPHRILRHPLPLPSYFPHPEASIIKTWGWCFQTNWSHCQMLHSSVLIYSGYIFLT